ncbi:MAG TPA: hypothetical protein VHZ76_00595 [Gammaproteobacteria bacterium]|jgi:hypothetical protein|nr:hypothetical protein [Gammaproteobacteria bacterium]
MQRSLSLDSFFSSKKSHLLHQKNVYPALQDQHRRESSNKRVLFKCSPPEKLNFKCSKAQLTISVGQPQHEGKLFLATLMAVNANFDSVVLMIDDSIQARTLAILALHDPLQLKTDSLEYWIQKAIRLGDDWLKRNEKFCQQLTIPYEIVRWSSWVNTQKFNAAVKFSTFKFIVNDSFNKAINDVAKEFIDRHEKRYGMLSPSLHKKAKNYCIDYLIEECGVMMHLWPTLNCQYEIYPTGRNKAMDVAYELWIKNTYPRLLTSISLKFKREKISPQEKSDKKESVVSLLHPHSSFKL